MATKKQENKKYYSLKNILSYNADYNVLIGERSNGKTYAVDYHCLEEYWEKGHQMALVRRWDLDFRGKRGMQMFAALTETGAVAKITGGKYQRIVYSSAMWYLAYYDEKDDKWKCADEPFCFAFALNTWEHEKSASFPKVTNIFFDEFISRQGYLTEEFVIFMNVISTIVRDRDNVKIFMAGNTVNKYCPYFTEMGLKVKELKKGTIDIYQYPNNLTVALEYTEFPAKKKKSDKYFAFKNQKLNMITNGAWEIGMYPHIPFNYKYKEIKFMFFIIFDKETLQGDIIYADKCYWCYIHRKTTDIKNKRRDIVYQQEYSPYPNFRRKMSKPIDNIDKQIYSLFKWDKVFYQDNEVGEIVRNYLMWCKTEESV